MKQTLFFLVFAAIFISIGWFANVAWNLPKEKNPIISEIKPRPLEKYEIERLSETYLSLKTPKIDVGKILKDEKDFSSYEFSFSFDPTMKGTTEKKVTGLINIPKGDGPFPLIILYRGYVDQTIYTTGMGSLRVGEFLAENGYITLAPDFLGYAGSDSEAGDIFESRFQTYVTAINLLKALEPLKISPLKVGSDNVKIDSSKIGIWAHSNGGQIALTALEITGANYPTVLWAPNSAKFPYSILYYLDEAADSGKLIVTELSRFMADYDVEKFAFSNYLEKIKAPIHVNQGTFDDAIPVKWSDSLVKKLKDKKIETDYVKYPGADHNMNPSWQEAINNALAFYINSAR